MKKDLKLLLVIITTEILLLTLVVLLGIKGYQMYKEKRAQELAILNIEKAAVEEEITTKYDFIDTFKAVYIEQMSRSLEIDPDLAFAILMCENPDFNENAIHINENGTTDEGLFQLNDKYFWTTFRNSYWNFEDIEPDPFNWKHNTYIALHHIKYLQDKLRVTDEIIMAYNGGIGAVMNEEIKPTTYAYLNKVKNNLWLLKNCYKEQNHE